MAFLYRQPRKLFILARLVASMFKRLGKSLRLAEASGIYF